MLSAMLRTLDLRDQMTARHSRRRRPLLAGDRPAGRLLAPRGGAGPHRRAAARHRQVHPPRPDPQGQRAAHRRGLDADQAPPAAGRAGRLLARRLRPGRRDHPRPPRADRRQRLSARSRRGRDPRAGADHLRRRHLRRDDRARLLPDADVQLRRDRRAAPRRRQAARRPLRRGLHRAARGQGRLLPATARRPTSRRSWRWKRGSPRPPAPDGDELRPLPGRRRHASARSRLPAGDTVRAPMRAVTFQAPERGPDRGEARPRDRRRRRRGGPGRGERDLRLRPPHLPRAGAGRAGLHDRPRVRRHGAGGRRRRRAGRRRRPRARLLPHRLRDLRLLPARRLPPLRATAGPSATAPTSATCRAPRPSSCWCRAPT